MYVYMYYIYTNNSQGSLWGCGRRLEGTARDLHGPGRGLSRHEEDGRGSHGLAGEVSVLAPRSVESGFDGRWPDFPGGSKGKPGGSPVTRGNLFHATAGGCFIRR